MRRSMRDYTEEFVVFRERLKELGKGLVNSIRPRVDTSDIVQDFCVQLSQQHAGNFSDLSNAYVNRALLGHASKSRRLHNQECRDQRLEKAFSDTADRRLDPEAIFAKREVNARLVKALQSLPADLQRVVFLRIFAELTVRQVAEELDLSERRTQLAFDRAIAALRNIMREDYPR